MNNLFVFDNSPRDKKAEQKRQQDWIEHCKKIQKEWLAKYKEILKPEFFKKLSDFIDSENERKLNDDKIRFQSKIITVSDAINKLLK